MPALSELYFTEQSARAGNGGPSGGHQRRVLSYDAGTSGHQRRATAAVGDATGRPQDRMPSVWGARSTGGGPPLLEHEVLCVRAVRVAGGAAAAVNGSAAAAAAAASTAGTDAAEAAAPERAKRLEQECAKAGAATPAGVAAAATTAPGATAKAQRGDDGFSLFSYASRRFAHSASL